MLRLREVTSIRPSSSRSCRDKLEKGSGCAMAGPSTTQLMSRYAGGSNRIKKRFASLGTGRRGSRCSAACLIFTTCPMTKHSGQGQPARSAAVAFSEKTSLHNIYSAVCFIFCTKYLSCKRYNFLVRHFKLKIFHKNSQTISLLLKK